MNALQQIPRLSASLFPVSTRHIWCVYSSLWSRLLFRGNKKPIWSWEAQRSFEGSQYKANSWLYWDGWCSEGWAGFTCMEMCPQNPWSRNKSEGLLHSRILMPSRLLARELLNSSSELDERRSSIWDAFDLNFSVFMVTKLSPSGQKNQMSFSQRACVQGDYFKSSVDAF